MELRGADGRGRDGRGGRSGDERRRRRGRRSSRCCFFSSLASFSSFFFFSFFLLDESALFQPGNLLGARLGRFHLLAHPGLANFGGPGSIRVFLFLFFLSGGGSSSSILLVALALLAPSLPATTHHRRHPFALLKRLGVPNDSPTPNRVGSPTLLVESRYLVVEVEVGDADVLDVARPRVEGLMRVRRRRGSEIASVAGWADERGVHLREGQVDVGCPGPGLQEPA